MKTTLASIQSLIAPVTTVMFWSINIASITAVISYVIFLNISLTFMILISGIISYFVLLLAFTVLFDQLDLHLLRLLQRPQVFNLPSGPGFVYIFKREDGILKLGRTKNIDQRLDAHRQNYKAKFEVVAWFLVPDMVQFEKIALEMTKGFSYLELGHVELRQMTDNQLAEFLDKYFDICKDGGSYIQ